MGDICHNSRVLPCPRAKHRCKTWTEGANVGRSQKHVSLKRIRQHKKINLLQSFIIKILACDKFINFSISLCGQMK